MDHCAVYASGPAPREALPAAEPGPPDPFDLGPVTGFYLPRFQNLGERDDAPFLRGYGVQGGVGRGRAAWSLVAYGEVLPDAANRVTLDPARRDAHGLPVARVEYAYGPNERAMIRHMRESLRAIARAGGLAEPRTGLARAVARLLTGSSDGAFHPGSSNHEVGGARMGADPARSVVDPASRLWDVPNVFVCDGACFPSSGFQNVTLTLMALAVRASETIVRARRAGGP
jgi:choline dehydrogenase-like flavoprotein